MVERKSSTRPPCGASDANEEMTIRVHGLLASPSGHVNPDYRLLLPLLQRARAEREAAHD